MNPRIRELAEQAEQYTDAWFREQPTWSEVYDQTFAQLIVQECVEICMKEFDTGLLMAPQAPQIAEQIRQHFGVEQ
jgi:hypothetical protein